MIQLASRLKDVECVNQYLSKCPYAEYTQIDDVYDDGDVYVLTVGMAVRKDELTKTKDKKMPSFEEQVLEIAFGDDAVNRGFTKEDVLEQLRLFSDRALRWEQEQENDDA